MLIVVIGVPGAGKSTLVCYLQERFGWKPVDVYTTRPPRPTDIGRISISKEELVRIIEAEGVGIRNYVCGNEYFISKKTFETALTSPDVFLMDVAPLLWDRVKYSRCLSVLLMPQCRAQLKLQVQSSATPERLNISLKEHDALSAGLATQIISQGAVEITNIPSDLGRTAINLLNLYNIWYNSENRE
jgi:guanylate kinase